MVVISPEHGLVFLKTRKTAGTSIEIELSRHVGDDAVLSPFWQDEDEKRRRRHAERGAQNYAEPTPLRAWRARDFARALRLQRPTRQRFWNHMTAADVQRRLPQFDRMRLIAVVRNPWDVLASRFEMHRNQRRDVRTVDDLIERLGVVSNWPIYTIHDQVVTDIVRYENLAEELPSALASVGISISANQLPRAKVRSGRPNYRRVLETRHIDLVASLCWQEIEAFGYEY